MADFKKSKNVFHLVEWILAVLIGALLSNLDDFGGYDTVIGNQFINGTVYGFVVITSVIFLGICVDEELDVKMGYATTGLGGFMYLATGIVVLYFDDSFSGIDEIYYRGLVAGIFCLVNAILFLTEFFLSLFKKSALESDA